MSKKTSKFRNAVAPWLPFAFCVCLSCLVMFSLIQFGKIEAAYPAFFCFLPMTFFFVANAVIMNRKEIKRLSEKIEKLEIDKE